MVKTNNYKLIKQDPRVIGAKPVYRSDNENTGGEFTWSFWLFMDKTQSIVTDSMKEKEKNGAGEIMFC